MQLQGDAMNTLALEAKKESTFMHLVTEKMQSDSRVMRVLTSVAFVYLPASLIAVSPRYFQCVGPPRPRKWFN